MKVMLLKVSNFLAFLFFILVFVCCAKSKQESKKQTSRVEVLPYYNDPTFTPHWLQPKSNELEGFHKIPDFKLINQEGDTITQRTFENKIYITDFFFTTCPGICPKMTDNMAILQEEFKNDKKVLLLSHSVTPEYDSVPVLKSYALDRDILSNKWHLVTGDRKQIYNLGRNFYYVEEDLGLEKDENDFLHTENFILIDQSKHIRGIYNGLNKASIAQLIEDIGTLKSEF